MLGWMKPAGAVGMATAGGVAMLLDKGGGAEARATLPSPAAGAVPLAVADVAGASDADVLEAGRGVVGVGDARDVPDGEDRFLGVDVDAPGTEVGLLDMGAAFLIDRGMGYRGAMSPSGERTCSDGAA